MKRSRLKLVQKRKPLVDDLSFMPPYAEQARYIELANTFLSRNGLSHPHKNVVSINQRRPRLEKPKSKQRKIS